jgi:hypothetical protein
MANEFLVNLAFLLAAPGCLLSLNEFLNGFSVEGSVLANF